MRLKNVNKIVLVATAFICATGSLYAGNADRSGQSGGSQLLINPFTRSSGWGGANSASVFGLESQYLNVAGIAQNRGIEVLASHTSWLSGTKVGINSFGVTTKAGNSGALALSFMTMDFGSINTTTYEQPEGTGSTFKPQYANISLGYAKEFSNSIFGGINVKVLSESISNLRATGICFDAGIQYVTSFGKNKELKRKNVHFGISLKNVGPQMGYNGDGLSTKATLVGTGYTKTVEFRTQKFDLPSLINLGGAYDFYLSQENTNHRITAALNFTSNSFTKDQFNVGVEYGFKSMFMLRGGFVYEKNVFDSELRTTALTGPTAGFSFDVPLTKKGTSFGIDYSYRATNPFAGCHNFGLRLKI